MTVQNASFLVVMYRTALIYLDLMSQNNQNVCPELANLFLIRLHFWVNVFLRLIRLSVFLLNGNLTGTFYWDELTNNDEIKVCWQAISVCMLCLYVCLIQSFCMLCCFLLQPFPRPIKRPRCAWNETSILKRKWVSCKHVFNNTQTHTAGLGVCLYISPFIQRAHVRRELNRNCYTKKLLNWVSLSLFLSLSTHCTQRQSKGIVSSKCVGNHSKLTRDGISDFLKNDLIASASRVTHTFVREKNFS